MKAGWWTAAGAPQQITGGRHSCTKGQRNSNGLLTSNLPDITWDVLVASKGIDCRTLK